MVTPVLWSGSIEDEASYQQLDAGLCQFRKLTQSQQNEFANKPMVHGLPPEK
jgi:hypothetical protein